MITRTRNGKANKDKVTHYLNGLSPSIREKLSLVRMTNIEDAYINLH